MQLSALATRNKTPQKSTLSNADPSISAMEDIWELSAEGCYVALTHDSLDAKAIMDRVRSPAAGAIVVFAGMFAVQNPK